MPSTSRHQQKDRRQKRRHPVEDVRGSLLFSYRCRVLDLSADGMAVRTNTPLAPGRSYTLKLEHGARGLRLSGSVAWCRLEGTERDETGESVPVYRAGIQLGSGPDSGSDSGSGSDPTLGEIRALLEQRGVVRLERRISGRIALPGETGAAASGARGGASPGPSFVVRRLSRSGMVLEASILPTAGDALRLEAALEDGPLELLVQVTAVRELSRLEIDSDAESGADSAVDSGAAAPAATEPAAEITVTFGDLDASRRARLDTLIRDELGLV